MLDRPRYHDQQLPTERPLSVADLPGHHVLDQWSGVAIGALRQSSGGTILLDVLLDHAGVPDGIGSAWQAKHYLGAPVPGATIATVSRAHVVVVVNFLAEVT